MCLLHIHGKMCSQGFTVVFVQFEVFEEVGMVVP